MNDGAEHWTVGIRCFSLPVKGLPSEELSLKISRMIYVMTNQCPDFRQQDFHLCNYYSQFLGRERFTSRGKVELEQSSCDEISRLKRGGWEAPL